MRRAITRNTAVVNPPCVLSSFFSLFYFLCFLSFIPIICLAIIGPFFSPPLILTLPFHPSIHPSSFSFLAPVFPHLTHLCSFFSSSVDILSLHPSIHSPFFPAISLPCSTHSLNLSHPFLLSFSPSFPPFQIYLRFEGVICIQMHIVFILVLLHCQFA